MSILIVEDEPKTGACPLKGLTESGCVADLACSGPDGLSLALRHDYDPVLFDVMLPGLDGWAALRQLRECQATPVLMLTARGMDDVLELRP